MLSQIDKSQLETCLLPTLLMKNCNFITDFTELENVESFVTNEYCNIVY